MTRPFISFLTDFGPDGPAPICRGVMLGIAPDAQILDVAHGVRKYAVRDGAYLLWCALPYLPVGVHVGVVDPGVGTERLPIAIRAQRGDILIGPDNGLLVPAADRLGGIAEVRRLDNRELMLAGTSSTFHGRDIFSPVAAHLATGVAFEAVGACLDPGLMVHLEFPSPTILPGELRTSVLYIDSFGNARLAGEPSDLTAAIGPLEGGRTLFVDYSPASGERSGPGDRPTVEPATWERTFGRVAPGAPLLYEDSFGRLAIADNQGNVTARLGLRIDQPVVIRAA
jgi:S-adenosylmethionine hydrolase